MPTLPLPPPVEAVLDVPRQELARADWAEMAKGVTAEHREMRRNARRLAAIDFGHLTEDVVIDCVRDLWVPHESRWAVAHALAPSGGGSLTVSEIRTVYDGLVSGMTNGDIAAKLGRGRSCAERTIPRYANWFELREILEGWKWLLALAAKRAGVPANVWGKWHDPDAAYSSHAAWMQHADDRVACSTFASSYESWCREDPDILLAYLAGWYGHKVNTWAAHNGRPVAADVLPFCDDSEELYW